jgi:hypothetical protein
METIGVTPTAPLTLSPTLKRRLRWVRDRILARPSKFDMVNWMQDKYGDVVYACAAPQTVSQAEKCGTTCCIAGWLWLHTPRKERSGGVYDTCRRMFDHGVGAFDAVFYAGGWPEPFRTEYDNATTARQRSRVAARRIDYLIEKGL